MKTYFFTIEIWQREFKQVIKKMGEEKIAVLCETRGMDPQGMYWSCCHMDVLKLTRYHAF